MHHPFSSLLAVDLTQWWARLPRNEKFFLLGVALIASIALPLSLTNLNQTTSFNPKAADYPTSSRNRPPSISIQNLSCRISQPCVANLKATDPDITDELRLEVDFLPAGLALTNCTHASTLFADLGLTCTLEGQLTQKAKYSLLATVYDHEQKSATAIINLNSY